MASLAERFHTLRLEDGRPNVVARRNELNNLLQNLTRYEIRDLRRHLSACDFRKDILGNLPIEIVIIISEFLDLEDFMRARSICQLWRKKFSSPDLCVGIVNKFFPWMREDVCQIARSKDKDTGRLEVGRWLPNAASKRIKRLRGHYTSMYEYNHKYPFPASIENQKFCNGRIAANIGERTVLVRDLRSHRTIIIAEENRIALVEWSLFDQYLIHHDQFRGKSIMRAWSLKNMDSDDRLSTTKLPTSIWSYSAYQDRCSIITSAGDFLIWDIGGRLKSQAIPEFPQHLADYKIKHLNAQFQPGNPRHFYIISVASLEGNNPADTSKGGCKVLKLIIQEIQPEKADSVYEFDLRRGFKGDFPTLSALSQPISLGDGCFGFHLGVQKANEGQKLVAVVKFDIYTKAFTTLVYPQSACDAWSVRDHESGSFLALNVDERTLFWRDQAIVPTVSKSLRGKEIPHFQVAIGLDDCNDIAFQRFLTKDTRPTKRSNDHLLAADGMPLCRVAARYRTCSPSSVDTMGRQLSDQPDYRYSIRGDDDFIVLFGRWGYIVWCFDESVALPTEDRARGGRSRRAIERAYWRWANGDTSEEDSGVDEYVYEGGSGGNEDVSEGRVVVTEML